LNIHLTPHLLAKVKPTQIFIEFQPTSAYKRIQSKGDFGMRFIKEVVKFFNGRPYKSYEHNWDNVEAALMSVPDNKFLDVMSDLFEHQRETHRTNMMLFESMKIVTNMLVKNCKEKDGFN